MKKISYHWYYVAALLFIVFAVNNHFLLLDHAPRTGDMRSSEMPGYHFTQQYIFEGKSAPLWDQKTFGGKPLHNLAFPFYYPFNLLLSVFFSPYVTFNLLIIFHFILAAVGMYAFAFYLLKDPRASFIAGLVYALCPFTIRASGHPYWLFGLSYIPLILLLAIKTYQSKNFVAYSVGLGVVSALQFLSGGILQWYYTTGVVVFYFIYKAVGKNFFNRSIKSGFILVIFLLVLSSLIAIRFLPSSEAIEFTNRGPGLPKAEILRVGHLTFGGIIDTFIMTINPDTKAGGNKYGQVGIIGFLFLLAGLHAYFSKRWYRKKEGKLWTFFIITSILVIIFATGIFLDQLYDNVPGVKSQRGLTRSLVIYTVFASLFVALGYQHIETFLFKDNARRKKIFLAVVALVLTVNLVAVTFDNLSSRRSNWEPSHIVEENEMFQFMKNDPDIFRFHVVEITGTDYSNWLGSSIPNEQESFYGTYDGLWDTRYFHQFLGATFSSPAKLWGMFNMKYLVSATERNDTDYTLVKKFENLPESTISRKWYNTTAYVYQNNLFLPRAYFVPTTVLILGKEDQTLQTMYALMLQPEFDPAQTAIIMGQPSISDYTPSQLARHDVIVLTEGSVSQNSLFNLEAFKEQGGILLPDILENQQTVTPEDLQHTLLLLNNVSASTSTADIITYYTETPNSMTLQVQTEGEFLFVSDKYKLYPGWTAKIDGKEATLLRSNGVLAAIYIPKGANQVIFRYEPKSHKKGVRITFFSLLLLFVYLGYLLNKKRKAKK